MRLSAPLSRGLRPGLPRPTSATGIAPHRHRRRDQTIRLLNEWAARDPLPHNPHDRNHYKDSRHRLPPPRAARPALRCHSPAFSRGPPFRWRARRPRGACAPRERAGPYPRPAEYPALVLRAHWVRRRPLEPCPALRPSAAGPQRHGENKRNKAFSFFKKQHPAPQPHSEKNRRASSSEALLFCSPNSCTTRRSAPGKCKRGT